MLYAEYLQPAPHGHYLLVVAATEKADHLYELDTLDPLSREPFTENQLVYRQGELTSANTIAVEQLVAWFNFEKKKNPDVLLHPTTRHPMTRQDMDDIIGFYELNGAQTCNIAFDGTLYWPREETVISQEALAAYGKFHTIHIPNTVVIIASRAFENRASLETVVFEDNSDLQCIKRYAFSQTNVKSLTLPKTLIQIENYAFWRCRLLTSVTFAPGSVLKAIEEFAFSGTAITSLALPANIRIYGNRAFAFCRCLTTVTFSNSTGESVFVGAEVFRECSALEQITIPGTWEIIPEACFDGCVALETVDIETARLTQLGLGAFQRCAQLKHFYCPETLVRIGPSCFAGCERLQEVTFADNSKLQFIGRKAFQDTVALTSMELPDSIQSVGDFVFAGSGLRTLDWLMDYCDVPDFAFYKCASLTEVVLGPKVTAIGVRAFAKTPVFEGIRIEAFHNSELKYIREGAFEDSGLFCFITPSSVISIGDSAFRRSKLRTFCGHGSNSHYSVGKACFQETQITDFPIPAHWTEIPPRCFYDCKVLKDVTAPDSQLKTIGIEAFENSGICTFECPASVTTIDTRAFYNCVQLETMTILATNLKYINDQAFADTLLLRTFTVPVPANVQEVGDNAFAGAGLTTFHWGFAMTAVPSECFKHCGQLQTFTYTSKLKSIRQAAFTGTVMLQRFECINDDDAQLQRVLYGAFYQSGLKHFHVPASLHTISKQAFQDSALQTLTFAERTEPLEFDASSFMGSQLQELTLPAQLTSLPPGCFARCKSLTAVHCPNVTIICNRAFANSGLETFEFPAGIQELGDGIFAGCEALKTATFATGFQYTELPFGCFQDSGLESIVLPSCIQHMMACCFMNCKALQHLTLPENLGTIQTAALQNATGLKTVVLPPSLHYIGNAAFAGSGLLQMVWQLPQCRSILDHTFQGCLVLKTVFIGKHVRSIYGGAFTNTPALTNIQVGPGSRLTSLDPHAFDTAAQELPGYKDLECAETRNNE